MAYYIFGYGQVGKNLAARIQDRSPAERIVLVDHDPQRLAEADPGLAGTWQVDAVQALMELAEKPGGNPWIIPALPRHLLFEYLYATLAGRYRVEQVPVPAIDLELPFQYRDNSGALYLSYADFHCPGDCSEPEEFCTVTGLSRGKTLYALLDDLKIEPFVTCIVRSVQLAPGLGGFRLEAAVALKNLLIEAGRGSFLIGTSCSCHAVLNGLSIQGVK